MFKPKPNIKEKNRLIFSQDKILPNTGTLKNKKGYRLTLVEAPIPTTNDLYKITNSSSEPLSLMKRVPACAVSDCF